MGFSASTGRLIHLIGAEIDAHSAIQQLQTQKLQFSSQGNNKIANLTGTGTTRPDRNTPPGDKPGGFNSLGQYGLEAGSDKATKIANIERNISHFDKMIDQRIARLDVQAKAITAMKKAVQKQIASATKSFSLSGVGQ